MKLRISGEDYDLDTLDKLTLLQTLTLTKELRGYPFQTTFDMVRDILRGKDRESPAPTTDDEKEWEGLVLTAVLVWASQSLAGQRLSLLDACEVPVTEIEWVDDDGNPVDLSADEPEGKAAGLSPQGSAGAGGNRAERRAATRRTSKPS